MACSHAYLPACCTWAAQTFKRPAQSKAVAAFQLQPQPCGPQRPMLSTPAPTTVDPCANRCYHHCYPLLSHAPRLAQHLAACLFEMLPPIQLAPAPACPSQLAHVDMMCSHAADHCYHLPSHPAESCYHLPTQSAELPSHSTQPAPSGPNHVHPLLKPSP